MHGWDQRLLSVDGTVMPRWLVSRFDVHLNAEGYEVFALQLRSIIMQKDSESVDEKPAKKKHLLFGHERPRVQGVWSTNPSLVPSAEFLPAGFSYFHIHGPFCLPQFA